MLQGFLVQVIRHNSPDQWKTVKTLKAAEKLFREAVNHLVPDETKERLAAAVEDGYYNGANFSVVCTDLSNDHFMDD